MPRFKPSTREGYRDQLDAEGHGLVALLGRKSFAAKRRGILRGACMVATAEMCAAFPELTRVAGFCDGTEHFWCIVTATGEIVDPTAAQFEGNGELDYRPFTPGDVVRVGRCMNCGDHIYAAVGALGDEGHAQSICGDDCRREFAAYLDAPAVQ
jgi:hypothetical protein